MLYSSVQECFSLVQSLPWFKVLHFCLMSSLTNYVSHWQVYESESNIFPHICTKIRSVGHLVSWVFMNWHRSVHRSETRKLLSGNNAEVWNWKKSSLWRICPYLSQTLLIAQPVIHSASYAEGWTAANSLPKRMNSEVSYFLQSIFGWLGRFCQWKPCICVYLQLTHLDM